MRSALALVACALAVVVVTGQPAERLHGAARTAEELVGRGDLLLADQIVDTRLAQPGLRPGEREELLEVKVGIAEAAGRMGEASVWLSVLVEEYPEAAGTPERLGRLGRLMRRAGALERAREVFYRVLDRLVRRVSVDPSATTQDLAEGLRAAAWEIAETEYATGDFETAARFFERFRGQLPEGDTRVGVSWFREGDCRFQVADAEGAEAAYVEALRLMPGHEFAPEALLRLTLLYSRAGEVRREEGDGAQRAFLERVSVLEPAVRDYWQRRLGRVLLAVHSGDPVALARLASAFAAKASDPEWKELAGEAALAASLQPTVRVPGGEGAVDWARWRALFTSRQEELAGRLDAVTRD